ncbi:hypothetical protein NQZ68_014150, partial [Dissostichus eleginoides]
CQATLFTHLAFHPHICYCSMEPIRYWSDIGESEEVKKRRNDRLSQRGTEMRGKGAIENLGERRNDSERGGRKFIMSGGE